MCICSGSLLISSCISANMNYGRWKNATVKTVVMGPTAGPWSCVWLWSCGSQHVWFGFLCQKLWMKTQQVTMATVEQTCRGIEWCTKSIIHHFKSFSFKEIEWTYQKVSKLKNHNLRFYFYSKPIACTTHNATQLSTGRLDIWMFSTQCGWRSFERRFLFCLQPIDEHSSSAETYIRFFSAATQRSKQLLVTCTETIPLRTETITWKINSLFWKFLLFV